ncbi:MAG: hypothetical protein AB7P03_20300 [Kofleriaceae bacterium]
MLENMRRMQLAAITVVALSARSDASPQVSWADWVGSYDAKLSWQRCSAPGERAAQLELVATDGALAIDLAAAGGGLRALPVIETRGGWQAQQGDVAVVITRRKASELALHVELDSGCVITGKLRRRSSGIAACDRLVAWAIIEARCSKRTAAPLEDPVALAAQRSTWKSRSARTIAECTSRAQRLEAALIDAGCAPDPRPSVAERAPHCTTYVVNAARVSRCGAVPPELKARLTMGANAAAAAVNSARDSELGPIEAGCQRAAQRAEQLANDLRCPR